MDSHRDDRIDAAPLETQLAFLDTLLETSGRPSWAIVYETIGIGIIPSGLSDVCSRYYSDHLGPVPELTDADPNTPGFQVDLYDGVNHVEVQVYPTGYCTPATRYSLAITRAEGSVSVIRPNRPPTGSVAIRGKAGGYWAPQVRAFRPVVGRTMYVDVSHLHDRDGLDNDHLDNGTFSYQWFADDVEIAGATSFTHPVAATDLGKTFKVRVSFTDDRGTEETVTSIATEVARLPNSVPTGRPIIRGTAEVGQTLRADVSGISDANGLTNATFSYLWISVSGPTTDSDEYTLVSGDVGRWYTRVKVTYTDDAGYEETLYSEDLGVVVAPRPNSPATGEPAITGTAQVGETLTADTAGISDADGLANVSYSYQWVASDGTSDTDIHGATDSTYVLVAANEGKTIKVKPTRRR